MSDSNNNKQDPQTKMEMQTALDLPKPLQDHEIAPAPASLDPQQEGLIQMICDNDDSDSTSYEDVAKQHEHNLREQALRMRMRERQAELVMKKLGQLKEDHCNQEDITPEARAANDSSSMDNDKGDAKHAFTRSKLGTTAPNGCLLDPKEIPEPTPLLASSGLAIVQRPGAFPVQGPGGALSSLDLYDEETNLWAQPGVSVGVMANSNNNATILDAGCSSSFTTSPVVASPVVDHADLDCSGRQRSADLGLPLAEQYHEHVEASRQRQHQDKVQLQRKRTWQWCLGVGLAWMVVVVVVVVVLLLVVWLPQQQHQPPAPSEGDAMMDSNAPANETQNATLEDTIKALLPPATLQAIADDPYSPQAQAFQWILQDAPPFLNHNNTSNVTTDALVTPEERIAQRYALATLFYATSGPVRWRNTTHWLEHDQHECNWFTQKYFEDVEMYMTSANAATFVEMYGSRTYPCTNNKTGGYMEHLWLWKNDLENTLPIVELTMLKSLKSVSIFGNNNLQFTMGSELGLLTKLEGLEIEGMQAQGSLPTEIGLVSNFKSLLIANNMISGSIPTEFGLLTNLEYAMMSENELTGTLPEELANMSSLMWLYTYKNKNMTGTIPTVLGRVTTLELLNMYTNHLSGTIPSELGLLTRMDLLALSGNHFIGPIPTEMGQLTSLQQGLSLHDNMLTGTIPTEFGRFVNLTGVITGSGTYGLGLSDNMLQGHIPSELGNLVILERLFLHNNLQLVGPLPTELGNLVGLLNITMQGDSGLTGTIPDALCPAAEFDCGSLCGCNCTCSN